MNTEAGKIHGALWGFGAKEGYQHYMSNYDLNNTHKRLGTKAYREYMRALEKREPQAFPKKMQTIPKAPTVMRLKKTHL